MRLHNVRAIAAVLALGVSMLFTAAASAQPIFYTFSSGFNGDGFDWPASPTGLLPDGGNFFTPDGMYIDNYTGNNVFFDSQYQVAGNSSLIDGDAMWGNPLDEDFGSLDFDFYELGTQSVQFDFAWSVAGSPFATPDYLDIFIEDSDGRSTIETLFFDDTFPGFGGFDGYQGTFQASYENLFDDFENVDGEQFIDIAYMYIDLSPIITGGPSSEFAIDNFSLDGGTNGGGGEVFPSVNSGTIDVSNATLSSSVLRGSGTHSMGVSVTNGTDDQTTYSTELVPGGDFDDGGQITDATIESGQTIFNPNLVTLDRSLPTGEYESDITIINTGSLSDPDNTVTLAAKLHEAPLLNPNDTDINVNAAEQINLSNAAAPANGFRASVELTEAAPSGPFSVSNFEVGAHIKPGEALQGDVTFDSRGRLSGTHMGALSVGLEMTTFAGINNDIEVFLASAEPVDDIIYSLNYTLNDRVSDSSAVTSGQSFADITLEVNNAHTAAILVGGTSSSNQTVSLDLKIAQGATSAIGASEPIPTSIGSGVEVTFTIPGDLYVLQLTYDPEGPGDVPDGANEEDLRILIDSEGTLTEAVLANTDGATINDLFLGSYNDYLATVSGTPNLSDFGVDVDTNQIWAVLDVEGIFHVGLLDGTPPVAGDMDGNGTLDAFDVDDFELALADRAAYDALHPDLNADELGDFTGDNTLDAFDVAGFELALAGGGATIPEPAAGVLLLAGMALMANRRRRA